MVLVLGIELLFAAWLIATCGLGLYPLSCCLSPCVTAAVVLVFAPLGQSSGSVQLSEGMQKMTEAAATATAAATTLSKRVDELEEKVRSKDKRIQNLAQQKVEAEAQLQVHTCSFDAYCSLLTEAWRHFVGTRRRYAVLTMC